MPLSEPALRASLEMGRFRPTGLEGPPSLSVSFSRADFRRSTIAEARGTKRPAKEQPPGQPRIKAVCGLDYGNEKVKAVENHLSDNDHSKLGSLVERLHILADQLTRMSPSHAKTLFAQQVPQLERDLEKAKGAFDKQRKRQTKKESGPRSRNKKYVYCTTSRCIIMLTSACSNTEEMSPLPSDFFD